MMLMCGFGRLVILASMALAAGTASAGELTITMAGGTFSPSTVKASRGDVIRFVNDDTMAHNIFVPTKAFSVDLGKQEPGKTTLMPVGKSGKFEVECVIHQGMTMTVEVSP